MSEDQMDCQEGDAAGEDMEVDETPESLENHLKRSQGSHNQGSPAGGAEAQAPMNRISQEFTPQPQNSPPPDLQHSSSSFSFSGGPPVVTQPTSFNETKPAIFVHHQMRNIPSGGADAQTAASEAVSPNPSPAPQLQPAQGSSSPNRDDLREAHSEQQGPWVLIHSDPTFKHDQAELRSQNSVEELDLYRSPEETPNPSAPTDTAKFWIKVNWRHFTNRKQRALQKALQSWLSAEFKEKPGKTQKPSILKLSLMEDECWAEVEITPSSALEAVKDLTPVLLLFKDGNQKADATIHLEKPRSVTVAKNTIQDKNTTSSANREVQNNAAGSSEADYMTTDSLNRANTTSTSSEPLERLTAPLQQYWYMIHAYQRELELIEKKHGVSFVPEVSITIKPSSSPMSVFKASDEFQDLFMKSVANFTDAVINEHNLDSELMREVFNRNKSESERLVFTSSASKSVIFGPKRFTEMIKQQARGSKVESRFGKEQKVMDIDSRVPSQTHRSLLNTDMQEVPTHLQMDGLHWELMKLTYEEQLPQLKTKYGVSFTEERIPQNQIKLQARSSGNAYVNLEHHAIAALTRLYQKLASAVLTCGLSSAKDKTSVIQEVPVVQRHFCVVTAHQVGHWRLAGLPQHLGPALAAIEKNLGRKLFDEKIKKRIVYSEEVPHARGIKLIPGFSPEEGLDKGEERGRNFTGANDSKIYPQVKEEARPEVEGARVEEENCVICMDSFKNMKKLKCGHKFCSECVRQSMESMGPMCPVCKKVFGKLIGNQPKGTMRVTKSSVSLPGYLAFGTIEIFYDIPSGTQTEKHPKPGTPYYGTTRRAYLPDSPEGREVVALLQRAFDQRLIFTVGTSTTSGAQNAVTWNDIHHKTNTYGGAAGYGYPDSEYLKRVKEELKAKGIE